MELRRGNEGAIRRVRDLTLPIADLPRKTLQLIRCSTAYGRPLDKEVLLHSFPFLPFFLSFRPLWSEPQFGRFGKPFPGASVRVHSESWRPHNATHRDAEKSAPNHSSTLGRCSSARLFPSPPVCLQTTAPAQLGRPAAAHREPGPARAAGAADPQAGAQGPPHARGAARGRSRSSPPGRRRRARRRWYRRFTQSKTR